MNEYIILEDFGPYRKGQTIQINNADLADWEKYAVDKATKQKLFSPVSVTKAKTTV